MHAEERQVRIGHGVDQRAHEVAALGPQLEVAAAERDDPRIGVGAGGHCEPVRPDARAHDHVARAGLALRVADVGAAAATVEALHRAAGRDDRAR